MVQERASRDELWDALQEGLTRGLRELVVAIV